MIQFIMNPIESGLPGRCNLLLPSKSCAVCFNFDNFFWSSRGTITFARPLFEVRFACSPRVS